MKFLAPEIFIGLVAPIGTNLREVEKKLTCELEEYDYVVETIKITDLIFNFQNWDDKARSLKYFLKMEVCTELRKKFHKDFLAKLVICEINERRKKIKEKNGDDVKIAYIINQVKNPGEYKLLSRVYDINYIQISCFSRDIKRAKALKKGLKKQNHVLDSLYLNDKFKNKFKIDKRYTDIKTDYKKEILRDEKEKTDKKEEIDEEKIAQAILAKDYKDTYENDKEKKTEGINK